MIGTPTANSGNAMYAAEPGLEAYLREIDKVPLLTPEEEAALARRVARGDAAARDRMIRANLRLVVHVAGRYARPGVAIMDLIAEGNIGLMKAVERFKAERHTRFSTYATWWIRQYVRRALQVCGPTVRVPGYMVELISRWKKVRRQLAEKSGREPTEAEITEQMKISPQRLRMIHRAFHAAATGAHSPDMSWVFEGSMADRRTVEPEQALSDETNRELVQRCLDVIDEREAEVLRLRYGLDSGEPMTLEKIGKRLNLTRERIRQIESEALRKLNEIVRIRFKM